MKLNPIIYIILGVVILAGLFFVFKPKTQNTPSSPTVTSNNSNQQVFVDTKTVLMKPEVFEPEALTVQKNTKVIFKNEDTVERWPASNLHPTHGIYPEFDSRQPITSGQEWSFVFDKVGTWKMHDHLAPFIRGQITVVE